MSRFFQTSTGQTWSRSLPEQPSTPVQIGEASISDTVKSKEPRTRWRYELDRGSGSKDIPMLVQKDLSENPIFSMNDASQPPPVRNKPTPARRGFFDFVASLTLTPSQYAHQLSPADEDLFRDFDNLFRIFYNFAPCLDTINIADAYIQCKTLLTLADMYDALAVVDSRIDHHLLQFQSRLWK
ncbi:MAG: hypothetical protein M1818_000848 [Claussenomyces sp. TS43310]|nr:MAG: hypothetical protein M1818_000848 [Claussenomyces sp. TS43310]